MSRGHEDPAEAIRGLLGNWPGDAARTRWADVMADEATDGYLGGVESSRPERSKAADRVGLVPSELRRGSK